jgi:hypothetical protein
MNVIKVNKFIFSVIPRRLFNKGNNLVDRKKKSVDRNDNNNNNNNNHFVQTTLESSFFKSSGKKIEVVPKLDVKIEAKPNCCEFSN